MGQVQSLKNEIALLKKDALIAEKEKEIAILKKDALKNEIAALKQTIEELQKTKSPKALVVDVKFTNSRLNVKRMSLRRQVIRRELAARAAEEPDL